MKRGGRCMESQELVVRLNGGEEKVFRSWESINSFLNGEQSIWGWLPDALHQNGFGNAGNHYSSNLAALRQQIENHRSAGTRLADFGQLEEKFSPTGPLFYSESREAEAIFEARNRSGDRSGGFCYGIMTSSVPLS